MADDRQIPTAQPADRPSFKIKVGGAQISAEYQVQAVVVTREFNKVARADIYILDGDAASETFSASSADDFVPGNEVEVLAGYHGEEESIYKGLITRHGIRVYQKRPSVLHIECQDAAVKLTVGRKSAYFYDVSDADVIEQIASAAGVDTDVEATGVTHPQMVQFYCTDWDFVITRAEANGKLVATQDGVLIVKAPDAGGSPVLALTFGGNILEFEATMDARFQYAGVQSLAWAPADQDMSTVDAVDDAAVAPGNVSSSDLAAVASPEPLGLKHGGQLGEDELQAWADAEQVKSLFAKVRGRVRIQGFGAIKPGDVVELAGVGDRFNGNALVAGVRHEIDAKNWETDISFGLAPERFGSVARDIVEAPANGLLPAIGGLQIGLVTALEGDPDGEHRVQVRIPMIDPAEEGVWARVATLDAGDGRGTFWRPEIGDEVVLGFLNDDPRNPILLGMMHSSAKPAPLEAADDNHEKGIFTRSGIKLLFNDDTVVVSLETPNGNKLTLSDEDGAITLVDENNNTVTMNADGITLESAADLNITASGDVNIEGTNVTTTASAQLKGEGSSGAEITSSGSTVVKGSVVQIN
jgi:Rhs element Vgr protein